ncbi:MAG TPA: hypothetical protein VG890_05805 [Puia sp.]|nr:hypothetical protein [Puia sp.]
MKKIRFTAIMLCVALAAQAQGNEVFDPFHDRQLYFDILNITAILSGMYLVSSFLQQILRLHYNHRIKSRMLDRGTEENIVRELLRPDKKGSRKSSLQWFCMLLAIGIGLILVALTRPFGLHSLSILALSLAAGFGAYYYFTRQTVEE